MIVILKSSVQEKTIKVITYVKLEIPFVQVTISRYQVCSTIFPSLIYIGSFFFFCSSLANTCIDIVPNELHININEPIRLVCRIRSTDAFNEENLRVQWIRNNYRLVNIAECLSNYSSIDGTLYETLIIRKARKTDSGTYICQYGPSLSATTHVIVHQCNFIFSS